MYYAESKYRHEGVIHDSKERFWGVIRINIDIVSCHYTIVDKERRKMMKRHILALGSVTFLSCLFIFGVSSQEAEMIHLGPPTTGIVEGTIQQLDKAERFMVIEPDNGLARLKIFWNYALEKSGTVYDLKIGQPIIVEYKQTERIAATPRGPVGEKYFHRVVRKIRKKRKTPLTCEEDCMEMFNKGQLKEGMTLEECIEVLCQ